MRPIRRSLLLAASAAIAFACSDSTAPARPGSILLDADSLVLASGHEDTLSATVLTSGDRELPSARVTWSTSDSAVAIVDSTGVVRADSSGTAIITVTAGSVSASIPVRVYHRPERLVLDGSASRTLAVGDSVRLAVVAEDGAGRPLDAPALHWTSDSVVTSVDATGLVRAVGWGDGAVVVRLDTLSLTVPIHSTLPQVAAPEALAGVGVSWSHGCAVGVSGAGYCWGPNGYGQLGNGASGPGTLPMTAVSGGHAFTAIATGEYNSCGLDTGHQLWCWGNGRAGTLGQDTIVRGNLTVPTAVVGGHLWKQLAVGDHNAACAVTTDDVPYCWGHNDFFQTGRFNELGLRTDGRSDDPRVLPVSGSHAARAIDVGLFGGCLLDGAGHPWCWGQSYYLPSAAGSLAPSPTPEAIQDAPALASVVAHDEGGCGLAAAGDAWCWGRNDYGQLGTDSIRPLATFTHARAVAGGHHFAKLSAGAGMTCGIDTDGLLWCWGKGFSASVVGAPVAPPRRWGPASLTFRDVSVSNMGSFANGCAVTTDGKLYCW